MIKVSVNALVNSTGTFSHATQRHLKWGEMSLKDVLGEGLKWDKRNGPGVDGICLNYAQEKNGPYPFCSGFGVHFKSDSVGIVFNEKFNKLIRGDILDWKIPKEDIIFLKKLGKFRNKKIYWENTWEEVEDYLKEKKIGVFTYGPSQVETDGVSYRIRGGFLRNYRLREENDPNNIFSTSDRQNIVGEYISLLAAMEKVICPHAHWGVRAVCMCKLDVKKDKSPFPDYEYLILPIPRIGVCFIKAILKTSYSKEERILLQKHNRKSKKEHKKPIKFYISPSQIDRKFKEDTMAVLITKDLLRKSRRLDSLSFDTLP